MTNEQKQVLTSCITDLKSAVSVCRILSQASWKTSLSPPFIWLDVPQDVVFRIIDEIGPKGDLPQQYGVAWVITDNKVGIYNCILDGMQKRI